jgi:hypothetical protein
LSEDLIAQCEQALVLVGAREHLLTLDPAQFFWGCESLIDGWQPEEAIIRLGVALARVEKLRTDFIPAVRRCHSSRPREVLIVDQDMTVRFLLQAAFEQYGLRCRMAETGGDALRILRDEAPHAAVLDVNIPELDGFQVVEQVRAERLQTIQRRCPAQFQPRRRRLRRQTFQCTGSRRAAEASVVRSAISSQPSACS